MQMTCWDCMSATTCFNFHSIHFDWSQSRDSATMCSIKTHALAPPHNSAQGAFLRET